MHQKIDQNKWRNKALEIIVKELDSYPLKKFNNLSDYITKRKCYVGLISLQYNNKQGEVVIIDFDLKFSDTREEYVSTACGIIQHWYDKGWFLTNYNC